MMNKKLFTTVAFMACSISLAAQTLSTEFKGTSNGNPISPFVFCADPTALEYNGRLYVYGTNDHQEFIANGKKGDNTYGNIKSIVVFSTADMVNWTFHGTIDTKRLCSSWVTSPWYQGYGVSWAPSVTWRTNPETGEDEFFLYFCNSSHGVGVLKANSPIGPFKSPLNKLMIHYDSPGAFPTGSSANFDPGVVVDENGVGWISFGGLNDNGKILPDNARIAKLKPSMTEIDGKAVRIPAPYHFEANELNFIGGKYVYTYCSHWSRNDADWNAYKAENGISASIPGGGTMCYMVSDNPLDPNSWVFKGAYGPGVAGNNHSHLQKFKGNYYHIYHDHGSVLLDKMKSLGAVDASAGDYRSICVVKATVNESTATVNPVTLSIEGCDAIDTMNPYELQQVETMATGGGLEYEDFTNITKNGRINALGNDASLNMQVKMDAGDWTLVKKVDFGTTGASKFMLRAKGTGTLEIRAGRKGAKPSVTVEFSSTAMEDHVVELDPTKFQGTKTLYFLITSATDAYLDAWQFTEMGTDGIQTMENNKPVKRHSYDLSGRRLSNSKQAHGVIIEQTIDANGVKHQRKHLSGK
jgi:arabinoxylan arabinofuranohydrolase